MQLKSLRINNDLKKFAINEIAAFESEVAQGQLILGPNTKKSLENYKKYLRDIQRQL